MSEPRPIADRVRYVVYGIMPGSNREPIEVSASPHRDYAGEYYQDELHDPDWSEVWLARETVSTVILERNGKPEIANMRGVAEMADAPDTGPDNSIGHAAGCAGSNPAPLPTKEPAP